MQHILHSAENKQAIRSLQERTRPSTYLLCVDGQFGQRLGQRDHALSHQLLPARCKQRINRVRASLDLTTEKIQFRTAGS
jgi:hypothetical protein